MTLLPDSPSATRKFAHGRAAIIAKYQGRVTSGIVTNKDQEEAMLQEIHDLEKELFK